MELHLRRAVAMAALGCVGGCSSLLGVSGPRITLSLDAASASARGLVLRADVGGRRITLAQNQETPGPSSMDLRGDSYGSVPVLVRIETAAGDSVAAVRFTQEFSRGDIHWISAVVGPTRPIGFCIGALVANAAATGHGDTLFVAYGSLPEDAIC